MVTEKQRFAERYVYFMCNALHKYYLIFGLVCTNFDCSYVQFMFILYIWAGLLKLTAFHINLMFHNPLSYISVQVVLLLLIFKAFFIGESKLMSTSLTIESMDRHKGGLYICTASNGVGTSAITQVNVHVLCK